MPIEFRWLVSKDFKPGSICVEPGSVFARLQIRLDQDTGGCDVMLADPWGPWQDIPVVDNR